MSPILILLGALLVVALIVTVGRRGGPPPRRASTTATSAVPARAAAGPRSTPISIAEVAKHSTENDLWLIIDGKVYDFTSYIENHPGGMAIMNNAGGDASVGFHGEQHPARLDQMLPEFYVGDLDKVE